MAVRRPNKKSASTAANRKTVAGRKRPTAPATESGVEREAEGTPAQVAPEPLAAEQAEPEQVELEQAEPKPTTSEPIESAAAVEAADDFVSVDEPATDEAEADTEAADETGTDDDTDTDAESTAETVVAEKVSLGKPDKSEDLDAAKPTGKPRRPVSRVSTIKADANRSATPSDDAATSTTSWATRVTPTSVPSFINARLAVRLAVAAVVIGLLALLLAFTPGAKIGDNKAFVDQSATDELMGQARGKVCLPVAVTSKNFEGWSGQARAVLVGTALKNFNEYLPTQKKVIEQSKMVADCKVDSIGVRELTGSGDDSRAKVLANILVSQNLDQQVLNSASVRVDYTLEKHGDDWKISGIEPF
ncbi:hypothetical protein [Gordonia sp. CPCC 205333]|uniref:hypothetical protein n=1 Tax=Gordonia sp. CPCC 205333 TaxID=3140790 RepID=UPI003AF33AAD